MKPRTAGVAVVSGAGSGIGREVALALAQRGHRLALLGRRQAPLAAVLAGVTQSGLALEVDVREAASVAAAVVRIERELGPIEILVPAAGLARVAPFTELPVDDFVDTVATNLFGAANLFRPCLEAMVARRRGHLLPILSVASRKGFPSWTAYCASKWGLAGLVEALREELLGTGVRITAIVPGATDSPIWESVPGDWPRAKMIPPAAVARAVVWALDAGDRVEVEEIRLRPPGGDL